MITYVDTSTLLKLVIEEPGSDSAALIWERADVLASVRLVSVEGRAALAAANRGGRTTDDEHRRAKRAFESLTADLHLVEITEDLLAAAAELAEEEALRGYDAVHLAGALSVDASLLTSADDSLCDAAGRRGLHVANPLG